ncbi:MAG TPA: single-stranded DNA-binding protein [candidate division Zixibacteria bacterium]|nr:single-stranded DNA-binding protein [candidate division Zixibacteria bacterium]MDD4916991.1 single-stranded DNA-binding protein [candidate division Zixibacteria bacterium]MDM7972618.1 single-stranded DNA-binding protein [candidate division Zixibacteria bacterium]HOD66176.1 single-stranded DNA-binding protein [candidate division Zixibacteria bacterium]HPC10598.1 single-stranded DNA-binding protein [candidate division Zixibacteria bacterium]
MGVNKAILIGRLGKDPELKYTASGRPVTTFTLATTERWTNQEGQKQEQTTWHNIVAWGRPAEIMNEYLAKGREVYIEGRIVNRSYDDKDGNKRHISEIVVQNFQFIGSGREGGGQGGGERAPAAEDAAAPEGAAPAEDDLPF